MPSTLPIQLDRASREPLYRQIESQLRGAIGDGRLRPGTMLPGVRTLAGQLGVARITIVTAYEQLVSEGLLDARVGSGTRVARDAGESIASEPRRGLNPPQVGPSRPPHDPAPGAPDRSAPGRHPHRRRSGHGLGVAAAGFLARAHGRPRPGALRARPRGGPGAALRDRRTGRGDARHRLRAP